jgi:hypothetical protein
MKNQIITFLKERLPIYQTWPAEVLDSWVSWFLKDNRFSLILRKDQIIGVGLFRILRDPRERLDWWAHHPSGNIAWLDAGASCESNLLPILWNSLGIWRRPFVGFCRWKPDQKIKFYHFENINKKILKGARL